ncbi:hypothetical protein BBF96_09850 [Anoxybacter fermentans]|uniref:Colicin V production protein n=1 Tax=Anoxybacter fermentans TaxID=1323375 RepID=A0A3S9SZD1_9FIRM|nr:CvpA family protein [Anoxybacter fermentans]AZR73661.1 hypothetical protein BBF96_09850 [Anoxybacter fermentans]
MRDITLIDLGIILFLLFFLVRGYQQGLIRQAMALIGLLLGLKIASDHYLFLSTLLQTHFYLDKYLANIISFGLIFFLVIIVINLVGWILSGLTKLLFLSFIDRSIGAVIGLIKGGIIVYLILLLISKVPYKQVSDQLEKSVLAKDLLALTPYIEENLNKIIQP